jgi:ABC-2 type transport system ATP-binding protein
VIEAIRLTTRRGSGVALRQVSFDVRPGQVTGLVAPDGVSDALILRLMVQLTRGGGRTLFDGQRYRRLRNPVREVGVLLDADAGRVHHAARDHLQLTAATYNLPARRVDEVLELVGLADVAGKPLRCYNPSMAQRLGIATAIIGDPAALLLRDPCGGLEPRGVAWLHSFARAYAAQGRAVLVTGVSPEALCTFTDHVILVEGGLVVVDQPTERFLAATGHPDEAGTVVVSSPHIARLVALLTDAGAHTVHRDETTVSVTGLPRASIGELAFTNGVLLHELAETSTAPTRDDMPDRPTTVVRGRWMPRRVRVVPQAAGRRSASVPAPAAGDGPETVAETPRGEAASGGVAPDAATPEMTDTTVADLALSATKTSRAAVSGTTTAERTVAVPDSATSDGTLPFDGMAPGDAGLCDGGSDVARGSGRHGGGARDGLAEPGGGLEVLGDSLEVLGGSAETSGDWQAPVGAGQEGEHR